MFGHHQGGYARRPKCYDAPYDRVPEFFGREHEKILAQILRQRHGGLMGGHSPRLGGIEGHQPPFLGRHGMSPMMGGYPHHSLPPQMGMGPGIGIPMGLGMGSGMGVGSGLGMSPRLGTRPHTGMSPQLAMGLEIGMGGMGLCQYPFGVSSHGRRRHSPFGYDSPGPPRTHSFLLQPRHAYSPFGGARHSPLSPPGMMFGGDEDYDDMYRTPARHHLARPMRPQPFGVPPQRRSRRRDYQRSIFGESEDEYDDYDDYDDEYDEDDILESYFSGHSPHLRTLRY
jgi:hypothetical protein